MLLIKHLKGRAFFVALVLLSSCTKAPVDAPDLIILQTGRLRGNVVPDGANGKGALQNFPYIAGYVKQVREEARKTRTPVLLVDLGDSLTGSFASAVTRGENVATFFNDLKYDAIMLGNLDADLTPATLKLLKMPVLCPFAAADGAPAMPGTQFSTTVKKDKLEVQLLANFYGDTRQEEFPERFPSVFGPAEQARPFRDYEALVKKMKPPGDGVLRIFEWMKFEHEGKTPPTLLAGLQKLAVDFVLAHRVYGREKTDAWVSTSTYAWAPPVSLNILRNNKGFAVARADLKRTNGKWVLQKQQILPMVSNTAPADDQIAKALGRFSAKINGANTVIAQAERAIDPAGIMERYLAALASVPKTSVALYSLQSVRSGWPKGEIRVGDVYASLPWASGLVQFELTPEQVAALEKERLFNLYSAPNLDAASPRTVTTSDFLARVVAVRLGLDRTHFRTVVEQSEYVFFADYLRRMADPSINLNQPPGWTSRSAPIAPVAL